MKKKINKKTLFIAIGVVGVLGLAALLNSLLKPKPKVQKVDTYVLSNSSTSSSSSKTTSSGIDTTNPSEVNQALGISSSSETTTSPQASDSDVVKSVMQDYLTINLDDKSIDDRNKSLSDKLSPDCYKTLNIDSDSQILKSMLADWNKDKVLNTNSPVQLLNQSIVSLKIYANTADNEDFVITSEQQLKSPASENPSSIKRTYSVKISNGKVTEINKTSEAAG
jgi:hypothetical protein